jgi:hypothetical protein
MAASAARWRRRQRQHQHHQRIAACNNGGGIKTSRAGSGAAAWQHRENNKLSLSQAK